MLGRARAPGARQVQRLWVAGDFATDITAQGWVAFYTWLNGQSMAEMLRWLAAIQPSQLISVGTHISSFPAGLGAAARSRTDVAIAAATARREAGRRIPTTTMAALERDMASASLPDDQRRAVRTHAGHPADRPVAAAPAAAQEGPGAAAALVGQPGGAAPGNGPRFADEIARAVFPATPTYADRVATYQQVRAFGKTTWAHPDFGAILTRADAAARTAIAATEGRPFRESDWRVNKMSGFDGSRGGGLHPWGVAVDFNYDSSPYLMNERSGGNTREVDVDNQVTPVYHRIALLLLGRESIIPTRLGAARARNTAADRADASLYDRLQEENQAMIRYFRMMQDSVELTAFLRGLTRDAATWDRIVAAGTPAAGRQTALVTQMRLDYRTLSGRRGPTAQAGDAAPARVSVGDRPFEGGNAMLRDPQIGFLTIRREIVMALRQAGLRWGGTDFGGSDGDIMHFDMGFTYAGRVQSAVARAQAAAARQQPPPQQGQPPQPVQRHALSESEDVEDDILVQRQRNDRPLQRDPSQGQLSIRRVDSTDATFVSTDPVKYEVTATAADGKDVAAKTTWVAQEDGSTKTKKGKGKTFTFKPAGQRRPTTGSRAANPPMRFSITATGASTTATAAIQQDEVDCLRQEYLDMAGRTPPARSKVVAPSDPAYNRGNYTVIVDEGLATRHADVVTHFGRLTQAAAGTAPGAPPAAVPALSISSAYRNPRRNVAVGSEFPIGSRHVWGRALDLVVDGPTAALWGRLRKAGLDAGLSSICEDGPTVKSCSNAAVDHVHVQW